MTVSHANDERRRGLCEECGDEDVKMATTHACFKCYMRARREREPDLHNPSLRKEHLKLVKLYGKLMEVFAGLKVNDGTKDAVVVTLRPYFRLVEHLVNLRDKESNDADEVDARGSGSETDADTRAPELVRELRKLAGIDPDVENNISPELARELRALVDSWNVPLEIDGELNPAYFAQLDNRDKRWQDVLVRAASHVNVRAQKSLAWVAEQRTKRTARDRAKVNVNND